MKLRQPANSIQGGHNLRLIATARIMGQLKRKEVPTAKIAKSADLVNKLVEGVGK